MSSERPPVRSISAAGRASPLGPKGIERAPRASIMRIRFSWRRAVDVVGAIAVVAQAVGCAASRTEQTPRLDRTVITHEQMVVGHFATVYDAVAALRSTWLRPRGVDSFLSPSIVWVYLDGARIGDVSTLQRMPPELVNTVRFYDGVTATARWGVDNGAGVIHISTWSTGAPGMLVPDSTRPPSRPPTTLVSDSTQSSGRLPY